MSFDKRHMVMKAFIESQFKYCPLIWMFHSRTLSNKINRLHERALRLVYSDYKSSFCELLDHHKNIQSLAIAIYKYFHNLSPCFMNNIFKVNQTVPYDLRKRNVLQCRNPSSARYGTETISYIKIRKWKPDCPCRLCKIYLQHVGFV